MTTAAHTQIDAFVEAAVAGAPELTSEQRHQLRSALTPSETQLPESSAQATDDPDEESLRRAA